MENVDHVSDADSEETVGSGPMQASSYDMIMDDVEQLSENLLTTILMFKNILEVREEKLPETQDERSAQQLHYDNKMHNIGYDLYTISLMGDTRNIVMQLYHQDSDVTTVERKNILKQVSQIWETFIEEFDGLEQVITELFGPSSSLTPEQISKLHPKHIAAIEFITDFIRPTDGGWDAEFVPQLQDFGFTEFQPL
jgi:hypothetical protein